MRLGVVSGNCGAPYFLPDTDEVFVFYVATNCAKSQSMTHCHYSMGRVLCKLTNFEKILPNLLNSVAAHSFASSTSIVPINVTSAKKNRGKRKGVKTLEMQSKTALASLESTSHQHNLRKRKGGPVFEI